MARQQTRTTGGAYQNPTEGIVDYGAFARGFASTFRMPEEEEEAPVPGFDASVDQAIGYDFSVGKKAVDGLQESLTPEVSFLFEEWKAADGDKKKEDIIFKRLNRIDDGKNKASLLFTLLSKYFNASDRRQMPEITAGLQIERFQESLNKGNARFGFGKDEDGDEVFGIHINTVDTDFEAMKTQNAMRKPLSADIEAAIKKDPSLKEKLFGNETDLQLLNQPKRTFKATKNLKKVFIPTENLTENEIMLKYFKPPANLTANFSEIIKKNGINTKINDDDYEKNIVSGQYIDTSTGNIITETETAQILSEDGYRKINQSAGIVATEIISGSSYRENKDSLYIDAVFGTRKDIALNSQTPIGPYIQGFGSDGFKFEDKSYKAEDFKKIGKNGQMGGDIPLVVRNAISKSYAIDRYKIEKGGGAYRSNEFGHAVRTVLPVDTKEVTKLDTDKSERKISGLGKSAGTSYAKLQNEGTPIKDMKADGVIKILNKAYPSLESGRFADIPTAKTLYENAYIEQMNPVPDDEKETRLVAQRKFNDLMSKYKDSEIIFINDKNEVIGVDIRSIESIGKSLAEAYGIKNSADKQIFIDGFVNAQSKKQSKNANPLLQE